MMSSQRSVDKPAKQLLAPLRGGIFLLYGMTCLVILVGLVWTSVRDYRATISDAARQSTSLARSLSEHATRSLVSVEQAMQNVAEDIQRSGGIDKLDEAWVHQRLKEKVQLTPQVRAVIVIDRDGLLAAHGLEYPTRHVPLGDREYFAFHTANPDPKPRLGDPLISRTDNKWLIPLTRRINKADGSFNGLMLSGVEPEYFLHFYDSLQVKPGTLITLMRPDGTIVLTHPFNSELLATKADPLPTVAETPRFNRQGEGTPQDRFVVELNGDNTIPLVVRVSTPASQVLGTYRTELLTRLLIVSLLLVVITIMMRLLMRQIERIRQAEARLQLTQYTVDESPEMVLWSDRKGELRYSNSAFRQCTGLTTEQLAEMRFSDLFIGREVRWERILSVIQEHGRLTAEPQLKLTEGELLPVEITLSRMEFNDDSLICVTARDISARKKADEELRNHHNNLQRMVDERTAEVRTMLDANPLAVCLSMRNNLLVVNPAFKRLFGYEEVEIVGCHESLLYRSEAAYREARRDMKSPLLHGETYRAELEMCRQDGTCFWADVFARSLVPDASGRGVILIIDDVTARRAAAIALKQSEHIRRAVLDTTVDGFALIDSNRRFVEVNPALCLQLARPREALIGARADAVLGDTLADQLFPPAESQKDGSEAVEVELADDKNTRQFLAHSGNFSGESGGQAYRFVFLTDISHQKHIERSLLEAKEAAEAASQAKTSFLTNMSHELRTPMHAIMSFAQIGAAKAEALGAAPLARNYQRIHQSGKRLLNLINALLDMSQLDNGRMVYSRRRHILQATVNNACGELAALLADKEIVLEVDTSTPELSTHYDDTRITQVVVNLLGNSGKFSPQKGRIEINFIADAKLNNQLPAVGLSVRDYGPGIPEEELEHIFEAFVQVSKTSIPGSTGLGLSISRRIVADHKGELYARNHPEGGALFTLLLPAAEANQAAAES